ncbi:MAG: glucosaminidase domain-containing protein [Clostridia bacterium]|nr:glucosaminidase domain-containing protein [Clostridia bacterium]
MSDNNYTGPDDENDIDDEDEISNAEANYSWSMNDDYEENEQDDEEKNKKDDNKTDRDKDKDKDKNKSQDSAEKDGDKGSKAKETSDKKDYSWSKDWGQEERDWDGSVSAHGKTSQKDNWSDGWENAERDWDSSIHAHYGTKEAGEEAAKEAAQEAAKESAKRAGEEIAKDVAAEGTKQGALELISSLGLPGLIIIAIIILIIIIIGVIGYLYYAPNMVKDKLKEMATEYFNDLHGYIVGKDEAMVTDSQLVSVAQYLQDMGYDLVGMGFATDIQYKDGTDDEIISIESPIIRSYLIAENRTYLISNDNFNLKDMTQDLLDLSRWESPGSAWGAGMIHIDDGILYDIKVIADASNSITDKIPLLGQLSKLNREFVTNNLMDKLSVNRETNTLIIERTDFDGLFKSSRDVTYYNLEGWSGRYGKPFELLLTLHVATMAPDLVYEIAMNPALDTKVNIKTEDVTFETQQINIEVTARRGPQKITIDSKEKIDSMKEDMLLDEPVYEEETIKFLYDLWDKVEDIKTKDVYIDSVTNHWFRNVYFNNAYKSTDSDPSTDEMSYSGNLPPELDSVSLKGKRQNGMKQVADGVRGETNPTTKALFNGGEVNGKQYDGKYYIYDGSKETAEAIKNGTAEKQKIQMNKLSLDAFAMLEQMESLDSQLIYRDLKELVIELEYFTEDDFKQIEQKCLEWPIDRYTPIEWPYRKWEKQILEYGTLIVSKKNVEKLKAEEGIVDENDTTTEATTETDEQQSEEQDNNTENTAKEKITEGFSSGLDVLAMAKSTVEEVFTESENDYSDALKASGVDVSGSGVKLKITSENRVKDYTLIIFGFDLDSGITVGKELEAKTSIGKTTDSNICMILLDKNRAVVSNIEDYIIVPEPETEDNFILPIVTSGEALSNVSTKGDYNITDSSYFVTNVDQFKAMFSNYKNIVNNAQAFLNMQSKYGVNAVFAAAVTITESSGGTSWGAIAESTHNWFSLTGAYNGKTYKNPNSSNKRTWRVYPDFATAVDDFGNLIKNGSYYIKAGKVTPAQMSETFCGGSSWGDSVNKFMTQAYSQINK